jgi:hypothetical protein
MGNAGARVNSLIQQHLFAAVWLFTGVTGSVKLLLPNKNGAKTSKQLAL